VMDEFQRVETKVVKDILSETRKFNLYAYLSMQYLGQMQKEIHDSIVSNIRNIVSFKLNKQDATMISSIMEIKIEESFKKARTQTELEESKKEMFVRLHQRECIVRLFDGKKYILPMKLHVVDVARWGYKASMEVSKMDAMHDASDSEGKPPIVQYGSAQHQSGAYSVNYSSQSSRAPPVVPPHEQPEEEEEKENEEQPAEEKENPFAPQDAMEESGLMISKDDETPSEEEQSEGEAPAEEPAAEEDRAASKRFRSTADADEEPASEEEAPVEEGQFHSDEEISPDEEPIGEEAPEEEKPAPRKKGRRGMVRVDFDELDAGPVEKPAKKSRKAAPAEEEPGEPADDGPAPAKKRSRKPREAPVDDEGIGEAPLTQAMDDDEELAAKLARIREKAMRVQMEHEQQEEAAPAKKAAGKKAAAKKPAKKGRKK